MLETPGERTKLLRAGFTGKEIEKLYIEHKGLKIVQAPYNIELIEFDITHYKETCAGHETAVVSV